MNEYVYVVEHELGPMKIGRAKQPKFRLKELQVGSPYKLTIRQTKQCPDAQKVEKFLHEYFARFRRRGEWFDIPPSERDFEIPTKVDDSGRPSTRPLETRGRDIFDEWADSFDRLIDAYDDTRYAKGRLLKVQKVVNELREETVHE